MSTKAQKDASNKYNKNNTKGYYIRLNKKTDIDIITHLNRISNKTGYIKSLISKDMLNIK